MQASLREVGVRMEIVAVVAHRRVRGLESPYRADPMSFMEELWIEDREAGEK